MECHDAQRIVSETLDGERQPEAGLVDTAKSHCRTCPECTEYVKSLIEVQRLPIPQPPADLADRVIAAVREEARREAAVPAKGGAGIEAPSSTPDSDGPEAVMGRLLAYVRDPRNQRAVALWATAAATIIVVSTITAIEGIRQITTGSTPATQVAGESKTADTSVLSAVPGGGAQTDGADGAPAPVAPAAAPPAIVVAGVVYRATGVAVGVSASTLSPAGSTRTPLDAAGAAVTRTVLGSQDPSRVYVTGDAGELLGFERVSREYSGKAYVLSSGELTSYGEWPTLTSGMRQPTNPNGMPEFVPLGEDALGVEVYRSVSGGAEKGIAVAPGTSASDPAAGNPGWTWWVPTR